jgi:hypothetical protein
MTAPGAMDIAAWACELRVVIMALNSGPTFGAVADLQRLLARQPTHYLGGEWDDAVCEARRWLARAEAKLPPMVRFAPGSDPLVPAAPKAWEYADVG